MAPNPAKVIRSRPYETALTIDFFLTSEIALILL